MCVIWCFQHFNVFNLHDRNMNRIYIPQNVLSKSNIYGLFGCRIIRFSWRNYSKQKKSLVVLYGLLVRVVLLLTSTHACTHAHKFSHIYRYIHTRLQFGTNLYAKTHLCTIKTCANETRTNVRVLTLERWSKWFRNISLLSTTYSIRPLVLLRKVLGILLSSLFV